MSFGLWHLPQVLTDERELATVTDAIRRLARGYPLATPRMRDGTPLSVRVTSWGPQGWWSDAEGYRYVDRHPVTGRPWPAIPDEISKVALRGVRAAIDAGAPPNLCLAMGAWDTCLVNYYEPGASLGWHVDRTEEDMDWPILNLSLGAPARFEVEEEAEEDRPAKMHRLHLLSGDFVFMEGRARRARHRIARIEEPDLFARSPIRGEGRISLTWRVAKKVVRSSKIHVLRRPGG